MQTEFASYLQTVHVNKISPDGHDVNVGFYTHVKFYLCDLLYVVSGL